MNSKNNGYNRALEYFSLINLEQEYYKLALKKEWIESLARFSHGTAEKILVSNALKEGKDENGNPYFYLELEKKFSICTYELQNNSAELKAEEMMAYNQLLKELLDLGYESGRIQELIFQPMNWTELTETQKLKAQKIFIAFAGSSANNINNATTIMKRIIKDWDSIDTGYLSSDFVIELVEFYENEEKAWKSEDDLEKEELNQQSTTANGKSQDLVSNKT